MTKSLKSHTTSNHTNNDSNETAATPEVSSAIARPPVQGAPTTPTGFVAHAGLLKHRARVPHAFAGLASGIVTEVAKSTTFVDDFGSNAPVAKELAERVDASAAWQREVELATSWLGFAKDGASRSWALTSKQLAALAPAFAYAASRDNTIVDRYAQLAQLFDLNRASARRAAATRAAKKKAASKPAPAATQVPPTTPVKPTT
jgi:hypothetical protein